MAAKSPTKKSAGSKPAPAKASAAKPAAPAKKAAAKAPATPATTTAPAKKAPPAKPTKATTNGKQQAAKAPAAPAKKATPPAKPPFRAGPAEPLGGPLEAKFLEAQKELLMEEREKLLGQAESLEGEAAALMEDLDPGDVQFDDESGEGDTMVVERERDLALSAQARQLVTEIDAALLRIEAGTYGYSLVSGKPIPKDRLKAIPWAVELVEEKVGGLGRR